MRIARLLATTLLAGSVAACGGGTKPVVAATSATPTHGRVATTAQYASAVNAELKDFHKAWQAYQDDDCLFGAEGFACTVGLQTINLTAKTISVVILGASDPTSLAFIGAPPVEITSLVHQTLTDANTLASATSSTDSPDPGWAGAASTLDADVDAWEPYTHS